MRLKRTKDDYDSRVCAVSRCDLPSAVIEATGRLAKKDVPLCDFHWKRWCWELAQSAIKTIKGLMVSVSV